MPCLWSDGQRDPQWLSVGAGMPARQDWIYRLEFPAGRSCRAGFVLQEVDRGQGTGCTAHLAQGPLLFVYVLPGSRAPMVTGPGFETNSAGWGCQLCHLLALQTWASHLPSLSLFPSLENGADGPHLIGHCA